MAYSVMSSVLSDQQSTPVVKVNQIKRGGKKRVAYGYATIVATTVGQTNALLRIPGRARISNIRAVNASMGNGALNFDLYRTDEVTAVTSAGALIALVPLTAHTLNSSLDLGLTAANAASDLNTLFATQIGTAAATGDVNFDIVGVVVTVSTGAAVAFGVEVEYVLPE